MAARHSYSAEEGASTTGEDHEAFNSLDTRSRIRKKAKGNVFKGSSVFKTSSK